MAITKKGNQPITASRTAMRPRPPVLANQADTSNDAQKMIRRPPEPFADPQGPLNTAPGRLNYKTLGIPYEVQTRGPKPQSYGSPVMSDKEMFAAVGEPRKPSGYNQVNNGFQSRAPRSTGPDSQPRSTGGNGQNTRRTSQSVPAGETGAVRGDYRGMRDYTDPTGNKYANGVMYTDGVKKGSRARGAALTSRPAQKKGEAAFYGQR